MPRIGLTRRIIKGIHAAIDLLYDRAKARFLGHEHGPKRIYIGHPRVTLPSLFEYASAEERAKADQDALHRLVQVATSYVDAQRESTKARVVHAVDAWLEKAHQEGVKTDVATVLGGELAGVWGKATSDMQRIVSSESNTAKNVGILGAIAKISAGSGIKDPVVWFAAPMDDSTCDSCKRLHFMPDLRTPRLWYLSELKRGYANKNDEIPSLSGQHPGCRGTLTYMSPGYGFDARGKITYVGHEHDAISRQRGVEKSESIDLEPLAKSTPAGLPYFQNNKEKFYENGERLKPGEHHGEWLDHFLENVDLGISHDPDLDSEDPAIQDAAMERRHELEYPAIERKMREAPITINFPSKRLGELSNAGRFKNSFETGHSMGAGEGADPNEGADPDEPAYDESYHGTRRNVENSLFDIPHEAPGEVRPVYGAVHKHWNARSGHKGGAPAYGDAFVTLKPHVHERSTFTPDDSFGENNGAYLAEHLPILFGYSGDPGSKFGDYIEAQIHGGVDLRNDVASLHLTDRYRGGLEHAHAINQAKKMGEKYGFPVYYHPAGDDPRETIYEPTAPSPPPPAAAEAVPAPPATPKSKRRPKLPAASGSRTSRSPKPTAKLPGDKSRRG